MPTVHREGPFRFFFYSNERAEPAHVHVEAAGHEAKVWLSPDVTVAECYGLRAHQLARIVRIVLSRREVFLESWRAFHADGDR